MPLEPHGDGCELRDLQTAETAYIQRRLVKALEDVMATYQGGTRNSLDDVIQFVSSEDALGRGNIVK